MLQNLQNFAKFQKFHLDNLVDFEKCCKTRIHLQRSAPIQPKTSEILPKNAKKWQPPFRLGPRGAADRGRPAEPAAAGAPRVPEERGPTLGC